MLDPLRYPQVHAARATAEGLGSTPCGFAGGPESPEGMTCRLQRRRLVGYSNYLIIYR
jgi:hypothetical protein